MLHCRSQTENIIVIKYRVILKFYAVFFNQDQVFFYILTYIVSHLITQIIFVSHPHRWLKNSLVLILFFIYKCYPKIFRLCYYPPAFLKQFLSFSHHLIISFFRYQNISSISQLYLCLPLFVFTILIIFNYAACEKGTKLLKGLFHNATLWKSKYLQNGTRAFLKFFSYSP